jgi:hypothetical protein
MNQRDQDDLVKAFAMFAEVIDSRIKELEERVKELEREPRKSLRQQLREKGVR